MMNGNIPVNNIYRGTTRLTLFTLAGLRDVRVFVFCGDEPRKYSVFVEPVRFTVGLVNKRDEMTSLDK